jgi:DNA-binding transcriptional MerR regulator/methylmalonyl-CoA mutase cobalamin-binding subunit
MAGISPGLLRAWERRYQLVEPRRTDSGYRVYSAEDVELLSAAARLVDAGHSISEVARLSPPDIHAAAGKLPRPSAEAPPPGAPASAIEPAIAAALHAVEQFDRERFEAALLPVLSLGALSPAAACEEVLMPLLRAMGDAWEKGALSVAAEHFGSALVRAKIVQYLQFVSRPGQGPRLVFACPEHERHEGGLLAFAVHAAASGWDVIYLGATTPVGQALETALSLDADAVALSFTYSDGPAMEEAIAALELFARAHARPRVVAGGRQAVAHRAPLERAGVLVGDHARISLDPLRASAAAKKAPR